MRSTVENQIEDARIFMNEGLLEDAKRVLHAVLMVDESNVVARARLEEVQRTELQQIFGDAEPRRRLPSNRESTLIEMPPSTPRALEDVVSALDRDLGLGITPEGDRLRVTETQRRLFGDDAAMAQFSRKLDEELRAHSPRDRLDVGIAFHEMGLYDLAANQFRAAARSEACRFTAQLLLAAACLGGGRPFEATVALEPWIADSELPDLDKIHAYYLMGRAQEQLSRPDLARDWYLQVQRIDSGYRDTAERLRRQ